MIYSRFRRLQYVKQSLLTMYLRLLKRMIILIKGKAEANIISNSSQHSRKCNNCNKISNNSFYKQSTSHVLNYENTKFVQFQYPWKIVETRLTKSQIGMLRHLLINIRICSLFEPSLKIKIPIFRFRSSNFSNISSTFTIDT